MIQNIQKIYHPSLLDLARNKLQSSGRLCQDKNGFTYVKVTNDFIYRLFPLVQDQKKEIPDYFSTPDSAGAHITFAYLEEWPQIPKISEVGRIFEFQVEDYFRAEVLGKIYYALSVQSNELTRLRKKYLLPALLDFRGSKVPFHITIATSMP